MKIYHIKKIVTREAASGKKNGILIPIWKDTDPIEKIHPRYIYFLTCGAGRMKGPYLHTKRRGLLTLIEGRALLVFMHNGNFVEQRMDATKHAIVADIPAQESYCIMNPFKKEARFVNICNYPWKKGDTETTIPDFSEYFKKYGGKHSKK